MVSSITFESNQTSFYDFKPCRRPTGKTPDEQVRPIKINALHKKIEYFKKSIDLQKQQIEVI